MRNLRKGKMREKVSMDIILKASLTGILKRNRGKVKGKRTTLAQRNEVIRMNLKS